MNKASVLCVDLFHPISLDEINSVVFMKRTDTKFVIRISSLSKVLEKLSESYKVVEIKGKRIMSYSSLYLDTRLISKHI